MAAKYHISDNGTPGACRAASPESCPKTQAGDSFHGTLAEATAESEKLFEANHGVIGSTSKKQAAEGTKMAAEAPRKTPVYSTDYLISAVKSANLDRIAREELFTTELGDDLVESSMKVAGDGESFTVRARNGFSIRSTAPGVGTVTVARGDRVEFNKFLEVVDSY